MEIINDYPPNIEKIRATFTLHKNIVFTYGQKLFNPDNGFVNDALLVHEGVHAKQQGEDPEAWWDRYLIDSPWRAAQEIQAYRAQFKAIKKIFHGREQRHQWLIKFAADLSGPMYGSIMPFQKAYQAIKHDRFF